MDKSEPAQPENQTPANPQPEANPTPNNKKLIGIMPLKVFLILLGVGLLISGGYYLGFSKKISETTTSPSPTHAMDEMEPSTAMMKEFNPTDSGIPINANTVSFTRVNGEVFMRYKGKIYSEEAANKNDPSLTKLPNPDSHTWYGLIDAPTDVKSESFDELFDFKVLPNQKNFLFIMRWAKNNEDSIDYKIFQYADTSVTNVLNHKDGLENNAYNVPRFKQVSNDGKWVAFNMYGCWNCGGPYPETLLFNLDSKQTKRIGKVSYFNWKEGGTYEYKEYKVIACEVEGPGECSEDPKNLPMLNGTM